MSVLTKNQKKTFTKDLPDNQRITAEVRFDDDCDNGHNTFSITGSIYEGKSREPIICGCIHDEIREHFPELAPFIKFHLCSTDGPLHYLANTLYLAGDTDHWGLKKGEIQHLEGRRTGKPIWRLPVLGSEIIHSYDKPTAPIASQPIDWEPVTRIGEGKEPDLEGARSVAIWEDATLEQLQDREALAERLPALLDEFRKAVESLGFTY